MTYRELHRNELGWIASHVASDLLAMNEPNAHVSAFDLAKIEDARKRDAAMATFPKESNYVAEGVAMKTWDDVQQAAFGRSWSEDPSRLNVTASLFHHAVTLVEIGELTREQAMIQLALGLADLTQKYFDQLMDLRNTMITPSFVLPRE